MLMAPFLEMPFKSPTAPVTVVPTYLTLKFLKCIKKKSNLVSHKEPIKDVAHGRHQFLIEKEMLHSKQKCITNLLSYATMMLVKRYMKVALISYFTSLHGLAINNKGQNCFCHTVDPNAKQNLPN
jgi:hypothetical protein